MAAGLGGSVGLAGLQGAPAFAQSPSGSDALPEETRVIHAGEAAATSPFVTVIPVTGATEQVRTLAETLAEAAGVQVRTAGGLGGYSAVSIRGSSSAQVTVFLDGVPLTRDSLGVVDLSSIPLDSLERIEIYRGQAPADLPGQPIGGAINLVTRQARGTSAAGASGSYGSFGTRKVDLYRLARSEAWSTSSTLSYLGAQGDFPFRNGNGTAQNPNDDFTDTRRNNDFDQIDAHMGLHRQSERSDVHFTGHAFWRDSGLPGSEHVPSPSARLGTLRLMLDGRAERSHLAADSATGRLTTYLSLERRHFADLAPTSGALPSDATDWTGAGGAIGRLALAVGKRQLFVLLPEMGAEYWTSSDQLQPAYGHALRVRGAATISDSISLGAGAFVLEPALRGDLYRTEGSTANANLADASAMAVRADVALSPRLGARWRTPAPALSIKGNVGRYVRLPTFTDLYAHLGYFQGRPDLLPEESLNWDVGPVWEWSAPASGMRLLGELVYFERRTDHLILYIPGFRYTSPENAPGTTARGVETAASIARGGASLLGNYTLLDLRYDETGKHVLGRPGHEGYVRGALEHAFARLRGVALGGFYELNFAGPLFADASNDIELPSRLIHGAGLFVRPTRSWTISVDVKNLTDQTQDLIYRPNSACPGSLCPTALEDFGGYPLPGRAFYATLAWKE